MRYVVKHTGPRQFAVIDTISSQTLMTYGQEWKAQEYADDWNRRAEAFTKDVAVLAQLPPNWTWLIERTARPAGYALVLRDASGGFLGVGDGRSLADAVTRALQDVQKRRDDK
jgi:hypothetical protein